VILPAVLAVVMVGLVQFGGDQVIGNVTIVDNLSTRLEYIPESATSSVDANFLTEPNAAGSTILRWEINDPVEPGEGGILRFRVRVR
jgi:hypothetical protein